MRRMQRWVALGVAGLLAGCATPQMTAGELARRADQNMLEAQQSLAGKNVIVSGVVKSTSLAPRAQMVIVGPGTAARTQEQVPLVILQPGSVLCYFEPGDIGDASSLHEGDSVALKCEVKYFETVEHLAVSNLIGCRRSK
jgi:hypothetical protein